MKKALIVTTVSGFVPQFELNNVKILLSMNYEIHYASNFSNPVYQYNDEIFEKFGIVKHQVDFVRDPHSLRNIKAYNQLKEIISEGQYDLIHCHAPIGGTLTRIAARKAYKQGTKILCTVHGFHFYKGSLKKNWIFYYPMERCLSRWTNVIITINNEDYDTAKKFMLHKKGVVKKVNGVGVQVNRSRQQHNLNLRKAYSLNQDDFIVISIGEITTRKNYEVVVKAIEQLKDKSVKYFICGSGVQMGKLQNYIYARKLTEQVFLLGYRTDIFDLLSQADCFIHPSLQEGLSVVIMEAMRSGVPIVCSNIRGNRDLITDGEEGLLVNDNKPIEYATRISELRKDKDLCKKLSLGAQKKFLNFDLLMVDKQMRSIYQFIED